MPIVKEVTAALINESPLDGILDGWKNQAVLSWKRARIT
jgi:hypothetical protein